MEIITMESAAYKELTAKIDLIAGYVRENEQSKKKDAAKYMPQNQGQPFTGQLAVATAAESKPTEAYKNGKAQVNTVGQVHERVVSGLSQPMSDSAFVAEYSKERNMGFHTAVGTAAQTEKNTIRACIHDNQTVTDGQAVRLRLLEPMRAGETVIPQNALVTGMGKIQGERLGISITSLEYRGMIIPVELTVVDGDGQEFHSGFDGDGRYP